MYSVNGLSPPKVKIEIFLELVAEESFDNAICSSEVSVKEGEYAAHEMDPLLLNIAEMLTELEVLFSPIYKIAGGRSENLEVGTKNWDG